MEKQFPSTTEMLEKLLEDEKYHQRQRDNESRETSLKSQEVFDNFNKRVKKLSDKYNIPYNDLRKRFMNAMGINGYSTDSKIINEKIESAYLIMMGGHPIMNLLRELEKENP